tara:strand:- start:13458 stop:13817 length:360 start_codon:yes stop_codon:yes gene_type:complete
MSYESTSGLGVSNHYGVRSTGGTEGIVKTEGLINYYTVNFDGDGPLGYLFPVIDGVEVISVDADTFGTAGVETVTLGGVDIVAASEAAPVSIAAGNTGVIATTNITAGTLVIAYKRLAV